MGFTNWDKQSRLSLGGALLGASIAIAAPIAVTAATPAIAATEAEAAAPEMAGFDTYTLPAKFSIEIPQGWFVEGAEAEGFALITSYTPDSESTQPTDIKTEVTLVNEPPETFVDREIDGLIQAGYVIDRFGMASVQGNDAFRLWIIEMPGDFANQVITFVGYDSGQTAKIVSYYNDESATMTDTIMQIHRSFELISEAE